MTERAYCLLLAALLCGCEGVAAPGWHGDTELVQAAETATANLSAVFGVRMDGPCTIRWGAASLAWPDKRIVHIDQAARGQPWLAEHVRHEVLHVLHPSPGHPAEINGVVVSEYVPSWTREVNDDL